jgi:hypothetical protein
MANGHARGRWRLPADHACTMYCEGPVHAVLITARAGITLATLGRWAMCHGFVLHSARRVIEVDRATVQAQNVFEWNAVTGDIRPCSPGSARSTDEVWMVQLSPAAQEGSWSKPGRWWRRRAHG